MQSLLDTTLDGVDRTINAGQANSDSEEDSATSTGGGSFSSGEQRSDSDEEEPGVTTPEPGALHPSQSVITHANPTPEYSVHHRTRKKAKAVPSQEPRTSQRSKKGIPPQRLIESLSNQVKERPIFLNVMSIVDNGTLRSYEEAMRGSKADQWKKATDNEYTAIVNNNIYRLVPLPKDRKSVTTKWIYKIKFNAEGVVNRG